MQEKANGRGKVFFKLENNLCRLKKVKKKRKKKSEIRVNFYGEQSDRLTHFLDQFMNITGVMARPFGTKMY